ncbi:MAG: hypothetical protein N3D15_06850 [Syntrophorhabdaceae bacterium]|nr:hypothetical protein [Syntrophorhabdaceae bacterium]
MKFLKVFILLAIISIISIGCSSLSVRDIKEMDPFLRGRTTSQRDITFEDAQSLYIGQKDLNIKPLS